MIIDYADHVKKMNFDEFKVHLKDVKELNQMTSEDRELKLAEMFTEATGKSPKTKTKVEE